MTLLCKGRGRDPCEKDPAGAELLDPRTGRLLWRCKHTRPFGSRSLLWRSSTTRRLSDPPIFTSPVGRRPRV
ncbi:hypothetical protein AGIG_G14837 [Arapaima gigas]